jgi:ADP-ribose pyrophosphatase YjhB (NUDIX family)
MTRDTYCSFCGTAYAPPLRYPRKCSKGGCGREVWANPIPVSIPLVPVAHEGRVGILVVRRAIEPRRGLLAIVGGFAEAHESWQDGAAREVREETGVVIDATKLSPLWFSSTEPRPDRVLLFSVSSETLQARLLPPPIVNAETSERGLVFGPEGLDAVFAFPLHARAARIFFEARGIGGAHDFRAV